MTWHGLWWQWLTLAVEIPATLYCVSPKMRAALRAWLAETPDGPTYPGGYTGGPTPEGDPPIPPIFRRPQPVAGKTIEVAPGVFQETTLYRYQGGR
jgi:hypothetical protein